MSRRPLDTMKILLGNPGSAMVDRRKQAYFDAYLLGADDESLVQITTSIIVYYFSGDKVTSDMSVLLRKSSPVRSGSQQLEEGATVDQPLSQ